MKHGGRGKIRAPAEEILCDEGPGVGVGGGGGGGGGGYSLLIL